jgi:hypothetical protein
MNPPRTRPWNLALRLGLEIGSLTGLGLATWTHTHGAARPIATLAVPLAAAVIWGSFNVIDDPSRSGEAPVEVRGTARLVIELFVLGGGWTAYSLAGHPAIGVAFAVLTVVHYAVALPRLHWLLNQ